MDYDTTRNLNCCNKLLNLIINIIILDYMSYLIDCRQIFFPITDSNILFHQNDLAFHNLGLIFISKK